MGKCADQDLIDRRLLSTEALEILLANGQGFRFLESGYGRSATGVSVKKCEDTKEVSGSEQREHGCFAQGRRHADAEAATFDEVQGVPQISGVEDHFVFDETPSPGDGEETPAVLFWHSFEQRPFHRSDLDTRSQGLPDSAQQAMGSRTICPRRRLLSCSLTSKDRLRYSGVWATSHTLIFSRRTTA